MGKPGRRILASAGCDGSWETVYLDEVAVCPRDRGVPGLGQDVLVVLRVDEHAETQAVLCFPFCEILLRIGLFFLHPQNGLKIDSFDL